MDETLHSPLTLLAAFVITLISLWPLRPIASKTGLMDHPGGRKDHAEPTPLIGGIGIYLGVLAVSLFVPEILDHYRLLLAVSTVVLLIGIMDDYNELSVSTRMGAQVLAAAIMFGIAGNQLNSLGDLLFFGTISLGILSLPITAFSTVGVINAVNMSDGIDGLCGSMVFIALFFLGIMHYEQGNIIQTSFIAVLICSLLAYLALNFRLPWNRPALIYLGDSGSTFLGFILVWLLIESTQGENAVMPPVLALWFLALPLMDTVTLLIKRPMEGRSPFEPGRDHLHHKLVKSGLSRTKTIILLTTLGILVGITGLSAHLMGVKESILFIAFLFIFTVYLSVIRLGNWLYQGRAPKEVTFPSN